MLPNKFIKIYNLCNKILFCSPLSFSPLEKRVFMGEWLKVLGILFYRMNNAK